MENFFWSFLTGSVERWKAEGENGNESNIGFECYMVWWIQMKKKIRLGKPFFFVNMPYFIIQIKFFPFSFLLQSI